MRRVARSLIILFVSVLALAQNRANFPWWNSPVAREIGLTPDQLQRVHQTVRSYRPRLFDVRNEVMKAEGDLEDVMNQDQVNPDRARAAIDRIANARAASSRVFLDMSVKLRAILTSDQWRLLVKRWNEMKANKLNDTQVSP